jgi:hypothetical protein
MFELNHVRDDCCKAQMLKRIQNGMAQKSERYDVFL